jgi:cytoskeletal protein RodZ
MNIEVESPASQPNQPQVQLQNKKPRSNLLVIFSVLVILAIILGTVISLSFNNLTPLMNWPKDNATSPQVSSNANENKVAEPTDPQTKTLGQVSSDDSLEAIEKDLNQTDLTNLDKEIQDISTELDSLQ